jgi:hypothetical protein
VPPSAVVAGLIAEVDPVSGAGTPAAGERGQTQYVTGLSQVAFSDTDRTELNAAGVNVIISKYGGFRNYGFRSLASPSTDVEWLQFTNWRLAMAIVAELNNILEQFLFDVIDGQGISISQFGGAIRAELMPFSTATPRPSPSTSMSETRSTPRRPSQLVRSTRWSRYG